MRVMQSIWDSVQCKAISYFRDRISDSTADDSEPPQSQGINYSDFFNIILQQNKKKRGDTSALNSPLSKKKFDKEKSIMLESLVNMVNARLFPGNDPKSKLFIELFSFEVEEGSKKPQQLASFCEYLEICNNCLGQEGDAARASYIESITDKFSPKKTLKKANIFKHSDLFDGYLSSPKQTLQMINQMLDDAKSSDSETLSSDDTPCPIPVRSNVAQPNFPSVLTFAAAADQRIEDEICSTHSSVSLKSKNPQQKTQCGPAANFSINDPVSEASSEIQQRPISNCKTFYINKK
jgi:hypothetical protein